MDEATFHEFLVFGLLVFAGLTALGSIFVPAPYGRYARPRWAGPDLPTWLAWMLMELPQPVGFGLCLALAAAAPSAGAWALAGLWFFHYVYRTLIYPFLPRGGGLSLSVVLLGFALNAGFSYANGRWLFGLGPGRGADWLLDGRFLAGAGLFFLGFGLHTTSDAILRRLRPPGDRTYRIPAGGAFRWVSCPNYLGELVQWTGWALASWSLAGVCILAVSAANLVPRALRHHRWLKEHLPDYPPGRKALVPFVL
jgi:protein-S-isoprenylcysteine O-methyltransferase Ste14